MKTKQHLAQAIFYYVLGFQSRPAMVHSEQGVHFPMPLLDFPMPKNLALLALVAAWLFCREVH